MFTIKSEAGSKSFDVSPEEAYEMIWELEPFEKPTDNEYFYRFSDGDYMFECDSWIKVSD